MKELIQKIVDEINSKTFTKEQKDELLDKVIDLAVTVNKIKPLDGTSDNPPHKPPNP